MSTTPAVARQWKLAKNPVAGEKFSSFFALHDVPLTNQDQTPEGTGGKSAKNKVLVKLRYLSNDPSQRTWIGEGKRSYMEPILPGQVMRAWGVGEVIESFKPEFKKGDMVAGQLDWKEYSLFEDPVKGPGGLEILPQGVDPADYLAMGMTALTAYFGLLNAGECTSNDKTVVISGAAGATGSIAVQIAKHVLKIPHVVGIAGSEEKCQLIKDLGCDVALNYKSPTFKKDFSKATPDFIDCYYDNVGGLTLDLALRRMKKFGRVVACGAIAGYESDGKGTEITGWTNIVMQSLKVHGFIVLDYASQFGEGSREIQKWIKEGKIKALKTVWEAKFEEVPQGLERLFSGDNVGKMVTKIVDSNDSKL